ncbi:hypothetical protein M011DRAFT_130092 [Sporormia fimetaria CBS 119925]|uniref:Uncharacterized protein n=1 Tax=Sporormia fimetaria CBS 119925 TaxID=1340428 RepID=A0A6A6V550_9PLEO|nr:hypothetical protein M011DRAFT_130092 [Sporormia fimetaria CBS 119925]
MRHQTAAYFYVARIPRLSLFRRPAVHAVRLSRLQTFTVGHVVRSRRVHHDPSISPNIFTPRCPTLIASLVSAVVARIGGCQRVKGRNDLVPGCDMLSNACIELDSSLCRTALLSSRPGQRLPANCFTALSESSPSPTAFHSPAAGHPPIRAVPLARQSRSEQTTSSSTLCIVWDLLLRSSYT